MAEAAEQLDWVDDVLLPEEVTSPAAGDTIAALFGRSHSETRLKGLLSRWGLYVKHAENVYPWGDARGTGHGSPYWYDRHVPFIVYGGGVPAGQSAEAVYTYDMAPTLAALAGLSTPQDLDGQAVDLQGR